MRLRITRRGLLSVPIILGLLFFAGLSQAIAATVYGINSSNQLVRFGATSPGNVTTVGPITGLQSGESVLGIDFRPATGQLYALGSTSRIYTVDKRTGAATLVGVLTTPLSGTNFGFDFNPVADRIRIVSDADQDLRANPINGSNVVDGTLVYSSGDPNSGQNPTVTGAAYIGSFVNTTSTTLYDIDSGLDVLVTQNPANSGMLQTIGSLGINVTDVAGFDHTAASNIAYASFNVAGAGGSALGFYTVNLQTGAATLIGSLGDQTITDIAVEIGYAEGLTAYGLGPNNQLIQFSTKNPNVLTNSVTVTGLNPGETLRGIDFRPATGELYGYGSDPTGAVSRTLYSINPITGAATVRGSVDQLTAGSDFGFDFNPTVDRIRIVNDVDQNRRANPDTGATISDGTLAYDGGDPNSGANPNIVAVGYENSFGGATSTRLFDIDSDLDILAQQNPANAGTLLTVGPLTWNTSANAGFDIIRGSNRGLAALELIVGGNPAGNSGLYEVDTATGTAAFIAPIGANFPIISLTVGFPTAVNRFDFDGNSLASLATFRVNNNNWYILRPDGNTQNFAFGNANTDFLTPADFDGDGKTDAAVWRQTEGNWYIVRSSDGTVQISQFGAPGDEPVARDYDGDGKADLAVVRRSGGQMTWFIFQSLTGTVRIDQFGLAGDFVAPGDYDGDGRFDLATFRGDPGGQATFFVQRSTAGFTAINWGLGSDLVAPGDYDGDGKTDFAVVRQGTPYVWYILRSSDFSFYAVQLGTKPHYTAQNDYDGDGRTDVAVYDPIGGIFYALRSTNNALIQTPFGQNGDYPIANFDTH
ncbi:MAG: DUF4394 domain-containing protein [Pyrinomonadaceae bacterium]